MSAGEIMQTAMHARIVSLNDVALSADEFLREADKIATEIARLRSVELNLRIAARRLGMKPQGRYRMKEVI